MEIVLLIEEKNYQKIREIFLKDELISKASIRFKDAKDFGKEGFISCISGSEEQCKKVLEIISLLNSFVGREIAKEIKGKDKEEIINKIKEEEEKAAEGFGSIFAGAGSPEPMAENLV